MLLSAGEKCKGKSKGGGGGSACVRAGHEPKTIPLAVPGKIIGLTPTLDFFDHCYSLASL